MDEYLYPALGENKTYRQSNLQCCIGNSWVQYVLCSKWWDSNEFQKFCFSSSINKRDGDNRRFEPELLDILQIELPGNKLIVCRNFHKSRIIYNERGGKQCLQHHKNIHITSLEHNTSFSILNWHFNAFT